MQDISGEKVPNIRSLTTRFRFKHVNLGCYLRSHAVTLPQWGFKQAEVVCDKKAEKNSINNWWNVEQHWNERRKIFLQLDADPQFPPAKRICINQTFGAILLI